MPDEAVERRFVSVLFADLVGFTSLSERLDPEDVATVQDAYFAGVRETVDRYGGVLEKFIGDAAMAVFGVPRGRDDDAERAVRAGLALVGAVEQLGGRLGLGEGELRLRVGVNTGEVVYAVGGPDEGRVTGDTVNLAARLQTAAPPGGVLLGEATALAVADAIQIVSVGELELKGKAERVRPSRATGVHATRSRDHAMGSVRAPILGRDEELAALEASVTILAHGAAARIVIVAPPGVGKTRLVEELARRLAGRVDASVAVWRARLRPEVVAPYDAVRQLMLAAIGIDVAREDAGLLAGERLRTAGVPPERSQVLGGQMLELLFPEAAADGSSGPPQDRDALFAAWMELLDALSIGDRAVWVVEDVHWAGPDLLAFLDAAGRQPATRLSAGRLVIATSRPSLLESAPDWCRPDEHGTGILELQPLPQGEAGALVRALVGDCLPGELEELVAQRSDGNPLFIEELLRTWISVGTLGASPNGGWELRAPVDRVAVPSTVHAIYAGQLDDLPAPARRVARRASVAGRRFPVAALDPLELPDGEAGLETLRTRALLGGPYPDSIAGPAYAYRHALLRDAAYSSLARAERARLHVRLAGWLQAVAGERAAEVAELIAHHYASALEAAPALAREVGDGLAREQVSQLAASWFEHAGEAALAASAHEAARTLLRRSLDFTDEQGVLDRARRWQRLGEATAFAADMDAGAAALEEAIGLYRTAFREASQRGIDVREARSGLARAAEALVSVRNEQVQFGEGARFAGIVLEEIGAADDLETARLLIGGARASYLGTDEIVETREQLSRALELARRAGDRVLELEALETLTMIDTEHGAPDEPGIWLRLEQLAREVGRWDIAVRSLRIAASLEVDDHAVDAWERLDQMVELAEAHGLTEQVGWGDYARAEAGLVSGDWDRAWAAGMRAIELGERNAYRRVQVRTWHVVVPMAAARGEVSVLERAARWFGERTAGFPDSPYGLVMTAAMHLHFADAGLAAPHVPGIEERLVYFDEVQGMPGALAALERIVERWLEVGEIEGARRALALWHGDRDDPAVLHLGRGVKFLLSARLATAEGADPEAVVATGRAALEEFRISAALWWIARTIWLLDRIGDASPAEVAEAGRIGQALKLARPGADTVGSAASP